MRLNLDIIQSIVNQYYYVQNLCTDKYLQAITEILRDIAETTSDGLFILVDCSKCAHVDLHVVFFMRLARSFLKNAQGKP